MTNDDKLSPEGLDALRARFQQQSRKAQAYYNIMHAVRPIVGSDDAANAWMNEAQPALGGKTPAELAGAGREDEVLAHVRGMKGA